MSVTLSPGAVTLWAPPDAGPASTRFPSGRALEVVILHNDLSVIKTARWEVQPADVATVSPEGYLRALGKAGTATIVAVAPAGVASASCTVTVRREGAVAASISAQGIPGATSRLLLTAKGAGYLASREMSPVALAADFGEAPAGPLTLAAVAYDAGGRELASSSATVIVQSGAVVPAELGLVRGGGPAVATMSVLAGGTGFQVELRGASFGSDPIAEPLKVFVDGIQLPSSSVFRTSPSQVFFAIPEWAARSTVEVDVGGSRASAPAKLTRLAAIALLPSALVLKTGATASLAVIGTDVFGGTWPSTPVTWLPPMAGDAHDHNHAPGAFPGGHPDALLAVLADGTIKATGTGDFHVLARHGELQASASVKVEP